LVLSVPIAGIYHGARPQEKDLKIAAKIISNRKGGKYGRSLPISIELIRRIGDIDTDDDALAFNLPEDIAVDADGNIYVLDSGNHRIQKFDSAIRYLSTIGRRGQGPGEFNYPRALDLDSEGNIYVLDRNQARIEIINPPKKQIRSIRVDRKALDLKVLYPGRLAMTASLGYEYNFKKIRAEGLPKLVKIIDMDGDFLAQFVDAKDYGGPQINDMGNYPIMAADKNDNIYLTYAIRNQIDKYSPSGDFLWSASRELNFNSEIRYRGKIAAKGAAISSEEIECAHCANGIATDDKERVWVITFERQLKKDELSGTMGGYGKGGAVVFTKVVGNKDFLEQRSTDLYKLEIFDSEGSLLGEIPLTHFADAIFIFGYDLFILDKMHACTFYQYRIVDQ